MSMASRLTWNTQHTTLPGISIGIALQIGDQPTDEEKRPEACQRSATVLPLSYTRAPVTHLGGITAFRNCQERIPRIMDASHSPHIRMMNSRNALPTWYAAYVCRTAKAAEKVAQPCKVSNRILETAYTHGDWSRFVTCKAYYGQTPHYGRINHAIALWQLTLVPFGYEKSTLSHIRDELEGIV
jgi:hypothetical protein